MRLPKPLSDVTSGVRGAKYKAGRAQSQAKRAGSVVNRARDKRAGSDGSQPEADSGGSTEPQQTHESVPAVAPQPDLEQNSRSSAVLFAVIGMLGAILAALLGLAVANSSDDRALFALIGVPLGAVLAIVVLISYGWAGLIDQPD
jgi:uncharacterized membrane protein YeaQ/YmgE (transglycosylase-associated protein family)